MTNVLFLTWVLPVLPLHSTSCSGDADYSALIGCWLWRGRDVFICDPILMIQIRELCHCPELDADKDASVYSFIILKNSQWGLLLSCQTVKKKKKKPSSITYVSFLIGVWGSVSHTYTSPGLAHSCILLAAFIVLLRPQEQRPVCCQSASSADTRRRSLPLHPSWKHTDCEAIAFFTNY